jgi:hypothetical protein
MLLAASFLVPYSRRDPVSLVFTLLRLSRLSCSFRREFHLEACGLGEGPGDGGAPGLGPTSGSALHWLQHTSLRVCDSTGKKSQCLRGLLPVSLPNLL